MAARNQNNHSPRSLIEAEENFIDRLGLIAEQGGLTRATGRIWALLVVTGAALPPADIASLLEMSRGSVSMGLKTLEQFDLLEQSTRTGDRQTYFAMRKHPYSAMIQATMKQATDHASFVRQAQSDIGETDAHNRLEDLACYYEIVQEGYQLMLDRMAEISARSR